MSEQAIDEAALGAWLEANVEGFSGPFELTKFPSGQSNPTYRLRAASGDYVLRRKPFGKLLPSAKHSLFVSSVLVRQLACASRESSQAISN